MHIWIFSGVVNYSYHRGWDQGFRYYVFPAKVIFKNSGKERVNYELGKFYTTCI